MWRCCHALATAIVCLVFYNPLLRDDTKTTTKIKSRKFLGNSMIFIQISTFPSSSSEAYLQNDFSYCSALPPPPPPHHGTHTHASTDLHRAARLPPACLPASAERRQRFLLITCFSLQRRINIWELPLCGHLMAGVEQ